MELRVTVRVRLIKITMSKILTQTFRQRESEEHQSPQTEGSVPRYLVDENKYENGQNIINDEARIFDIKTRALCYIRNLIGWGETNHSCKHIKHAQKGFICSFNNCFVCSSNNWWPLQHAVPKLDQLTPPLKKNGHWQLTRQPKLCQVPFKKYCKCFCFDLVLVICFFSFCFFTYWQHTNNLKQILLTILANICCLKYKCFCYRQKYLVVYLYKSLTLQDCKWILGHLTAKFGIINIQI